MRQEGSDSPRRSALPLSFLGYQASAEELLRGCLQELLQKDPWRIPVLAFCEGGGWPDPSWTERVRIEDVRKDGKLFLFTLAIPFEERVPKCCSDFGFGEDAATYGIPRLGYVQGVFDAARRRFLCLEPVRNL
jgi:hypothetical protein